MVRESDIEKHLVQQVKLRGGETRKVQWVGRSNAPDRRVMLPWLLTPETLHRPCWVELKKPGEKPTMAQYREHKRMRDLGEIVYVIDSFEKVDNLMRYGYV